MKLSEYSKNVPLVSVCIPTFNGQETIGATIQSVLNQDYKNIEIVISDDGSIDETLSVVRKFNDPRIRLLDDIPATTAAANWNRTWRNSTGELVKIMGQDDILYSNCISQEVAAFGLNQDTKISFVFSQRNIISRSDRLLLKSRGNHYDPALVQLQDQLPAIIRSGSNPVGEPVALLINRQILDEAGSFEGNYTIDLEMWLKLLAIAPALATNKTLVAFRVGRGSWSNSLRSSQADDTANLHKQMHLMFPHLVSKKDIAVGFVMARIMQFARIPGITFKEYELVLRERVKFGLQKLWEFIRLK